MGVIRKFSSQKQFLPRRVRVTSALFRVRGKVQQTRTPQDNSGTEASLKVERLLYQTTLTCFPRVLTSDWMCAVVNPKRSSRVPQSGHAALVREYRFRRILSTGHTPLLQAGKTGLRGLRFRRVSSPGSGRALQAKRTDLRGFLCRGNIALEGFDKQVEGFFLGGPYSWV